jgi:hypothetical protein
LAAARAAWLAYDEAVAHHQSRRGLRNAAPFLVIAWVAVLVVGGMTLQPPYPAWALFTAVFGSVGVLGTASWMRGPSLPSPPVFPRPNSSSAPPASRPSHAEAPPPLAKRVVLCVHCGSELRLPAGRSGRVTCPVCHGRAWYET